jgi:hypothetical protein
MALIKCKDCLREFSNQAKACPNCGKPKPSIGLGGFIVIVFAVFFFMGIIGSAVRGGGTGSGTAGSSFTSTEDAKSATAPLITLKYSWSKGGFDSVMLADFSIKNASSRSIKDVEIKCRHFAASGTQIDSNTRTIYELIKPNSTKRIPNMNMGFIHSQAKSSSCAVQDFVIVQ